MFKYFMFASLLFSSISLSALDSGTLSASLYYHVLPETADHDTASNLYTTLISQLEDEQAPSSVIQTVAAQYREFQNGEDVQVKAKELWLKLTNKKTTATVLSSNNFRHNPLVSSKEYRTVKPWILPNDHPMRARLDAIFKTSRAIKNSAAFEKAGFITFKIQPRSFIRVARHPDIPGYVLKVYLDTELRNKHNKPGWYWFSKRCEGAKRTAAIIKNKKMKYFKVAKKWIYPLPDKPTPPKGPGYSPRAEILIAEDMNIVSNAESKEAWKTVMTREHLDELFTIIAYAKGHSYRPDNIPYSTDGKFAFIDTEYPDEKPNFSTPMYYLSPEMATYWQQLIKQGGP